MYLPNDGDQERMWLRRTEMQIYQPARHQDKHMVSYDLNLISGIQSIQGHCRHRAPFSSGKRSKEAPDSLADIALPATVQQNT